VEESDHEKTSTGHKHGETSQRNVAKGCEFQPLFARKSSCGEGRRTVGRDCQKQVENFPEKNANFLFCGERGEKN